MKEKDLHDKLKSIPLSERPKMLPPPWEKAFFRGSALIAIGIPLALIVCNCVAAIIVRKTAGPIVATIIAGGALFAAHGSFFSGVSSSNTATICRSTEPIRFWISVICLYLAAAVISLLSWVI